MRIRLLPIKFIFMKRQIKALMLSLLHGHLGCKSKDSHEAEAYMPTQDERKIKDVLDCPDSCL